MPQSRTPHWNYRFLPFRSDLHYCQNFRHHSQNQCHFSVPVLLAAGKITQEEYNEYYPYDGMEQSYYSVFVETDLNTASTLSGKRLPTEDAIAEYIAGMLLLENDPVFYISYEGIYTTGGTDFYEFRCHR